VKSPAHTGYPPAQGIDLLIIGYARAEGQYDDGVNSQFFGGFKTNWGLELRDLIQHWAKRQ
jgi:hypothetical protein